jgi:hypothetical protein
MRFRRIAVALSGAGLLASVSAAPSLAATTSPYNANFPQEKTVQQTCPAGVPAGSFCFTGSDHSGLGTSTPPGSTATEDFAGFVDFSQTVPGACLGGATGFRDHNVVSIGTSSGNLFMRTDGIDCTNTGTDDGTWVILGGTGIFEGASGTGHVHTQATGGTGSPTNPITSVSTYDGTITLR